jgi:hypothetical protein
MQMIRPNLIDTSRLLANERLRAGNRRAVEKSTKAKGFASANSSTQCVGERNYDQTADSTAMAR